MSKERGGGEEELEGRVGWIWSTHTECVGAIVKQ